MSSDDELDRRFEEIVAGVEFDEPGPESTPEPEPAPDMSHLAERFGRSPWGDPMETEATWSDEGHFVPPDPGRGPALEPVRRAAWWTLLGSPALMVVLAFTGFNVPPWGFGALGLAFVGSFVYLVATMKRGEDDPWGGDDGAVL